MSVIADFGVNGSSPSVINTTGTTTLYFPRPSASPLPAPRSVVTGLGLVSPTFPNATNAAGQLVYPDSNSVLDGQIARIQVAGNASSVVSQTGTVTLQANTGTVSSPVYTTIASTSGTIPGTGSAAVTVPWSIECVVSGDSLSGILQGQYSAMFNGAYHTTGGGTNAWVPLDAIVSGINFAEVPNGANTTGLGFVVTFAFGTGAFKSIARLNQFQISAA